MLIPVCHFNKFLIYFCREKINTNNIKEIEEGKYLVPGFDTSQVLGNAT